MKQIFDKSVEEFDKLWGLYDPQKSAEGLDSEIKHFIKHHTLALIDAEIERVEGMRVDTNRHYMRHENDVVNASMKGEDIGYNTALTDHLTYLKKQRESISNS